MRRYILALAAILCLASVISAQSTALPGSFAGWHAAGPSVPVVYDRQDSSNSILDEYGRVSIEPGSYSRGSQNLTMIVFHMKDPSGAYGLYSFLRTPDMPHADLAEHSCMSRERALVLVGNLVLEVRGRELPALKPDLRALVAAVSLHAEKGLFPTLQERLPREGLIERTDHYILGPDTLGQFFPYVAGDWLGFSQGAEAELARYRIAGHDATLLIADFPTPQTAQKKLAELQVKYSVNGSGNGGLSPIFARRSMTLLVIVQGARTQTEAEILLNQVHSGAEVTWNEPSFIFKEPALTTMITDAIIGTLIICGFALISGLAFGGFRLVVKRMLPDKIFDRSSTMQVLQLGLSSKPIKAEDFYGLGPTPPK
jgi:hypothetical protein